MWIAPSAAEDFIDKTKLHGLKTGLICPPEFAERVPAPDTLFGSTRQYDGEKIVVSTRTVPMVHDLGFGFDISPTGPRVFEPVTVILTHPSYKGTKVTTESWQTGIKPGRSNLNSFVFEVDFEMVPGEWSFTLIYEDQRLLHVSFTVVPPEEYPNVEGLCDGELIASLTDIARSF